MAAVSLSAMQVCTMDHDGGQDQLDNFGANVQNWNQLINIIKLYLLFKKLLKM